MFAKKKKEENTSVTPVNMSMTPSVGTEPAQPAAPAPAPQATPVAQPEQAPAAAPVQTAPTQPAAPAQTQPVQAQPVEPAQPAQPAAPAQTPVQTVPVPQETVSQTTQARATQYGNSGNIQYASGGGQAPSQRGDMDRNVDYSYTTKNSDKEGLTPKKVVGAIIIVLFLIWAFFLYSDYDSAKNGQTPKYCFFGESVEEYDIGKITVNRGLGYKVVRYETEDTSLLEFSALWQQNKRLEDISKQ